MRRLTGIGLIVALVGGLGLFAGLSLVGPWARADQPPAATAPVTALPKLVDLGAKTCIPCKRMAPILEELKKDYAGRLEVEFIDVSLRENLPLARQYGISLIPTQVFLGADGKELWRHEGFLGKADILAKWKELGFRFDGAVEPGRRPSGTSRPATKPATRAASQPARLPQSRPAPPQ